MHYLLGLNTYRGKRGTQRKCQFFPFDPVLAQRYKQIYWSTAGLITTSTIIEVGRSSGCKFSAVQCKT